MFAIAIIHSRTCAKKCVAWWIDWCDVEVWGKRGASRWQMKQVAVESTFHLNV